MQLNDYTEQFSAVVLGSIAISVKLPRSLA